MNPLRILFVSPYLPSLIRVRPFNLIKYLAQRGHQITLLALVPPTEAQPAPDTLPAWCRRIKTVPLPRRQIALNALQALFALTPLQAAYSRSPQMARLIRQTLAEDVFDVAHVEHLRGAELSPAITGLPIVFDSVDSITLLFERTLQAGPSLKSRLLARLDLARTRHYESQLADRFQRVLITSPQDQAALVKISNPARANRIVVLPNGVDLDYFSPMDLARDPATVVFSGKMSYHANEAAALDLATQIMPLVHQRLPQAKLVLVGKDPSAKITGLAQDPRITVTGTVPDLRPWLAQAGVSVSPMRYGVGIQNKILEAMAMATPVITTSHSLAALQVQDGRDLLTADSPQATAEAIVTLLTDPARQRRMGEAGRAYVETCHNWRTVAQKLEAVYQSVCA